MFNLWYPFQENISSEAEVKESNSPNDAQLDISDTRTLASRKLCRGSVPTGYSTVPKNVRYPGKASPQHSLRLEHNTEERRDSKNSLSELHGKNIETLQQDLDISGFNYHDFIAISVSVGMICSNLSVVHEDDAYSNKHKRLADRDLSTIVGSYLVSTN